VILRDSGGVFLKTVFTLVCVTVVYFRLESPTVWNAIAIATALGALWGGRREERAVAAIMTAAVGLTYLFWRDSWVPNARAVVIIDAVETVALVAVALRSNLWWPSWCAAFHLMAVVNHLAFIAMPHRIEVWAYVSGIYIWVWLGLLPLVFGVWDAWAERRAVDREACFADVREDL
jgi:hypothetical protein